MKVWIRYFKTVPDVVCAETEQEAQQMDCSDACDTVEVEYVQEIDAGFLKRSHASWGGYIPEGDPDFRTLAEIFEIVTPPSDSNCDSTTGD